MSSSFYFYDLETSGVKPRSSRIMQFAGQRTTMDLKPIGDPDNLLIKQTEDILPDPEAILITGLTPQQTLVDGITEAEFVSYFNKNIKKPDTIFVGFNSIRFDDEFMRFLFFRNYSEPYEWQWKDGRSRWDILDVSRMTRALRPEGIKWPFTSDGKPTNRLESLTSINKLDHSDAHDALSDVNATISVAKLIKQKQPKLFEYLLNMRGKKAVENLVNSNDMFVYSSGKYSGDYEKTTAVTSLGANGDNSGALVYDLRHDPSQYIEMSAEELASVWKWEKDRTKQRLPIKSLQFNRCPAIAPLSVVDDKSMKRLEVKLKQLQKHKKLIDNSSDFYEKLLEAAEILNNQRSKDQAKLIPDNSDPDLKLYDGFIGNHDRNISSKMISAKIDEIDQLATNLSDERLKSIFPLYKARNFPKHLTDDQRQIWEEYRRDKLVEGGEKSSLANYLNKLSMLNSEFGVDPSKSFLLEELQLWAQAIAPDSD